MRIYILGKFLGRCILSPVIRDWLPCETFTVVVPIMRAELFLGSSVKLRCATRAPHPLVVADKLDRSRRHCYECKPVLNINWYRCANHGEADLIVVSKSIRDQREPWDFTYDTLH